MLFAAGALASTLAFGQAADDGQWPMPARTPDSTRFSPLAQITSSNVSQLKLAFDMPTGVVRGHEAAPIVEISIRLLDRLETTTVSNSVGN